MVWILGSPSCKWASNVYLDMLVGGPGWWAWLLMWSWPLWVVGLAADNTWRLVCWWAWLLTFNWALEGSGLDLKAGLLLTTHMKVSSPSVEEIVAVLWWSSSSFVDKDRETLEEGKNLADFVTHPIAWLSIYLDRVWAECFEKKKLQIQSKLQLRTWISLSFKMGALSRHCA
jgi:hypothetical protein